MNPKLSRVVTLDEGAHPESHVTHKPSGHVINEKRYIFPFTRPMDPKLSRVVT